MENTERIAPTQDDRPQIVVEAEAEREAAIARGEKVPQFDSNGLLIEENDG